MKTPIQIGYFEGLLLSEEKVQENGNLSTSTCYYIRNKKTNEVIAGISGDLNKASQQIQDRVREYYVDHSEEMQELLQQANGNNLT